MLTDIGLIVAIYALIRYIQMFGQPRDQTQLVAKVFAGFALVLTVILTLDLCLRTAPPVLK